MRTARMAPVGGTPVGLFSHAYASWVCAGIAVTSVEDVANGDVTEAVGWTEGSAPIRKLEELEGLESWSIPGCQI